MAKILQIPNVQDLGQILPEEDDKGFATVLAEHPEVRTLYERRKLYPALLEINGVNPIFHVMIEGIIENQLEDDELRSVREVFEKLQKENGFTAHAARASIARVFIHDFFAVINERKPFDTEAYVRRLALIGTNVSKLGRNDHCPCGSGAKFKRCCAPYAEAFSISPLEGRLNLGYGSYLAGLPEDIKDPLDPIFQLEARFHISEYMEQFNDIEGAQIVLIENIELAKAYQAGEFLKNAWQDYQILCENHAELTEKSFEATEQLIQLAGDDEEKGNLICDKADLIAKSGNIEDSELEYQKLFETLPDFHFGRFRYALMLSEYERESDAKKVLTALLADNLVDEETHNEVIFLLEDLGKDIL
ncbi:SEC-C metal-binding domain-containing protein [Desulfitobacterium sp.]|uniref:SEC-C metal-binding domain-containing protein n=1 Tax=Desulfitobacterium sp. TaxID=49981 RepID=UPI002C000920|nr:SEC-C metal-binding domain-containing protein [Desulfitobacterium sp.]HVJ49973.1 SEC-C metal-binding domain-containing protein [Desulfitobacterium sp.]